MAASPVRPAAFPYATALRHELSLRNRLYAQRHALPSRESYGEPPAVCYLPSEDGSSHGNFLPATYRAIQKNENWRRRLQKAHTQAQQVLPPDDRRWRELDSCNSSDALLMNIFCFPRTLRERRLLDLLAVEPGVVPEFGIKARVPLANGRADRTEVDMRLAYLLVEAKLTESDFQSAEIECIETYRDFQEVFERRSLPREGKRCASYQLIRNVLAAYAGQCSFCVMADARRPDLKEAWFAIMRCVKPADLRLRCLMINWQELAEALPRKLQSFVEEKYGIIPASRLSAQIVPGLMSDD